MRTSIVIPLGKGSRWNDTELRFALRSVEKHLSNYGEVFIIGDRPSWLKNVVYIPATDGDKTYEKERNIWNKIMIACYDERVTDEFLFMNDDHFLLRDFVAIEFPNYCYGFLTDYLSRVDPYQQTIQNTVDCIGDSAFFDVHCPIVYNKGTLAALNDHTRWPAKWGYCIKTLYCSFLAEISVLQSEYCPDLKIRDPLSSFEIGKQIAGRPWFSMDNRAREGGMEAVLYELFPNKSTYER